MIGRVDADINFSSVKKLEFEKNAFEHLPMTENASACAYRKLALDRFNIKTSRKYFGRSFLRI